MEIAEHGHPQGAAHFLEHMTFKGTSKRRVGEISATIEGWGGEINAYTTFDRTVYYLTVASEFALDALELLADAVFQSAIDPVEVERERKVILEEISRGLDDPGTRAAQKIFARAYEGSEAGRPVIGSVESVTATTREQLCHFRDTFYRPSNCGFVVVGDFDSEKVAGFLKTIADPARDLKAASIQTIFPKVLAPKTLAVDLVRGDYQQVRFDFAIPVPELEHIDTPALDMCAYLLGSGDLGLMNRGLRDEQGLVSSAAATLFSPAFPGLFEITILTSDDTALAAIEAVGEILAEFAKQGINLERLESRPTGDGLGQYCFSIDAEGHINDEAMGAALMGLRALCADIRYLGSYPRAHSTASSDRRASRTGSGVDSATWLEQLRQGHTP